MDAIYVKTPKGIDEVERKTTGLALKPRQVLIMIDGKRDLEVLQGIFPPEMVPPILEELLAGGFIRELERPKHPPPQSDEEDPYVLAQTFMINIAGKMLGIAGDNIIAQLRAAPDMESLRGLYPAWRSAVKENPDGLARMKEFENKLFKVMGDLSVQPPVKKPPSNDDERLVLARNFMGNSAKTFLGIAADDLVARINATQNIPDLRHLFFDWREALKQSPDAKRRLSELESKLAALLS